MTNFAVVNTAPVISSLASKEKGSLGNRVDCAMAHNANGLKTLAMTAGVLGASQVLVKNPKTASALEQGVVKGSKFLYNIAQKAGKYISKTKIGGAAVNGLNKIAYNFANNSFMQKVCKSACEGIKSLSTLRAKNPILFGIGMFALTAIGLNKYYKSGQIDQKYTDKAQMQGIVK